jgi:hypothetical protein
LASFFIFNSYEFLI